MKFKKVKSSEVSTGVAQVAGAGIGFMATNGIANAVAKVDDEALITEEQKKTKLYVAVAAIAVGGYLALATDGNDATAAGVKALGTGLAGGGVKGVVQHFAKDKVATLPTTSTTKRFVAGALGCSACETPTEKVYYPYQSLGNPMVLPELGFQPKMDNQQYSVE